MGIFNRREHETKTKPDFSNVKAGSSSTSPKSTTPMGDVESGEPTYTEYRVEKGDSLSEIAQRVYGDMKAWRAIYEANRDIIDDPDLIHPGQVLKLPKHH